MKIGPLGITEILIILAVVLLIFGPKNLPKLGTAIGKAVKNLREGLGGGKKISEVKDDEKTAEAEVEVIDKPEPGKKAASADDSSDEAEAVVEEVEKPKEKTE